MIAISLQSGSNGNCIYVETEDARLLFDAGISGVKAERRLAKRGREIRDVDAVIISHDHADHVGSAGIFQRKFALPVWITEPTLAWTLRRRDLGRMSRIHYFTSGQTLSFGQTRVTTLKTPHEGVDGVDFVITSRGKRLGILTDLGHAFPGLPETLATLDAVFLESNYDEEMLARGPYPPALKARIRGPGGHLSNEEAAALMATSGNNLRWACLAHLSEQNNTPEKALATHRRLLGESIALSVASRYSVGRPLKV
jgi:phosphoribosyl 1,2-cyclic phosphodiesterase